MERPPVLPADQMIANPRRALALDDADQVQSLIVLGEFIPMDGDHAGANVFVWACSEELPAHRAIGMMTVARKRLLDIYDDDGD